MTDPLAVRVAVQLRADARAAGAARHFISATCEASGVDADICSTAALLVSELVTNAVVHARTEVDMHILPSRRRLRVEVTDGDPTGRVEVQPHDVTGRGGEDCSCCSCWPVTGALKRRRRARPCGSNSRSKPSAVTSRGFLIDGGARDDGG